MGPEGCGKTFAALSIAGTLTDEFGLWPDKQDCSFSPRNVLWLDYESGEATVVERLSNTELDPTRFKAPAIGAAIPLSEEKAPSQISQWIGQSEAPLVVIDSLRYAFDGADENDSRIATLIKPYAELAASRRVAIILIHHTRKVEREDGGGWTVGRQDCRGSSTIMALPRSVLAVDKPDGEDERMRLHVVKSNLCSPPFPVGFQIVDQKLEWGRAPRVPGPAKQLTKAIAFLEEVLAEQGPTPILDLLDQANRENITRPTLYRAAAELDIVKPARGVWAIESQSLSQAIR